MAQVQKTVLIHHSAAQMFGLVDDVTKYPEFLPWCDGVDLAQHDETTTVATLHIAYHGLRQKFTTKNHKTRPGLITMKLLDGPFKYLEGVWRFKELNEQACKIEFELAYEFTNILLEKMINPVFSQIANTFVDSFVARADAVYKERG